MTLPIRIATAAVLLASLLVSQESRFHTNRPNPQAPAAAEGGGRLLLRDLRRPDLGRARGPQDRSRRRSTDVNLLAPDLVMTVGDLVQGYNDTTEWLAQAARVQGRDGQARDALVPGVRQPRHLLSRQGPAEGRARGRTTRSTSGRSGTRSSTRTAGSSCSTRTRAIPETGKYEFNDPLCQKMSPAQFAWLEETLEKAKGADHVFVFLHHPRWLKGGYGDDWDRVHALLKDAGNVTAVFAGHIHRMRWDGMKDGIEYFTLAVTGGMLPAEVAARPGSSTSSTS